MSSDVVTIVVPVFNVAPFLPHCLESLAAQSYPNLEIILVDDGSTDGSGALCDRFARTDPRVRVVHQPNAGLASARNAGMAIATGEFVLFIDSDDWVGSELVAHLRDVMRVTNADIVVGDFVSTENVDEPTRPVQSTDATVLSPDKAIRALLGPQHVLWTVAWGKLFRRSVLTGLAFPHGRLHEDEFFTYRALAQAERVALTQAAHYFYRQRPGSIMASPLAVRRGMDAIDAYRERADYIRANGPTDLVGEAQAQLFRRNLQLYRALDEGDHTTVRRELRQQMRDLARGLRGTPVGRGFRAFSVAYAWAPWAVEPAYALYTQHTQRRASKATGSDLGVRRSAGAAAQGRK